MNPDKNEAYILARLYNFLPAQRTDGKSTITVDTGKFEPDGQPAAETRTMVLASYIGRCNLLIKYRPADLEEI